jgi:hypothetical protein
MEKDKAKAKRILQKLLQEAKDAVPKTGEKIIANRSNVVYWNEFEHNRLT